MAQQFQGSLQAKKKSELQSLASALDISTDGTKEEIHTRIKKHLDKYQSELEDDPQFSGLFDRRRKRKESVPPPSKRDHHIGRRVITVEPIYESTPAKDLSDVSRFLKNPPEESPSPRRKTRSSLAIADTPSSLPPLPASPETSIVVDRASVDQAIVPSIPAPRVSRMLQLVKRKQVEAVRSTNKVLFDTRTFLSNSRTIWAASVLIQFLYIYVSIVPWQFLHIPFSATSTSTPSEITPSTVVPPPSAQSWSLISVTIPYPPLATFQSRMFWTILAHWFISTVLIPAVAGILISFRPHSTSAPIAPPVTLSESREISRIVRASEDEEEEEEEEVEATTSQVQLEPENPKLSLPFDFLTASIVRLAAQIAYTFPASDPFSITSTSTPNLNSIDVLGFRWRVLSASVGVAFAFAEAISGAGLFGGRLYEREQPLPSSDTLQKYGTVDTVVDSEVD